MSTDNSYFQIKKNILAFSGSNIQRLETEPTDN